MSGSTAAATTRPTKTESPSRTQITDLIPGASVNELYVLSDLQLRQGGKTGAYLTFRLSDATGNVAGVYWPADAGEAEEVLRELPEGGIVRVKGDVVSYRERTEVRVTSPGGGMSPFEGNKIDPAPFVPASKVTEKELREAVEVRVGLVGDPHLRRLLRSFFADRERSEAYFNLPARLTGAHAFIRGLAEEAVEAARIAGAAAGSIPGVDRDLVTTCALIAPAGAILAYSEQGLSHEETRVGLLLPRGVLAADLALRAAREASSIPVPVLDRVRHVLIREPDVIRWGWASGPETLLPEAVVLHHSLRMSRLVPEVREALARKEGLKGEGPQAAG